MRGFRNRFELLALGVSTDKAHGLASRDAHVQRCFSRKVGARDSAPNELGVERYCVALFHHTERNHQGLDNVIPFPNERLGSETGPITKSERLGGLLQFYYRKAA